VAAGPHGCARPAIGEVHRRSSASWHRQARLSRLSTSSSPQPLAIPPLESSCEAVANPSCLWTVRAVSIVRIGSKHGIRRLGRGARLLLLSGLPSAVGQHF
jgi:hypothetical protein